MEQTPPSYTPQNGQVPQSTPVQKSSAGPVIGAIIVILVLALGGLYFWGAGLNNRPTEELPLIQGDTPTEENTWLPPSGNSDEAAAIQAELEATDMNAFESEVNADLSATESSF